MSVPSERFFSELEEKERADKGTNTTSTPTAQPYSGKNCFSQ